MPSFISQSYPPYNSSAISNSSSQNATKSTNNTTSSSISPSSSTGQSGQSKVFVAQVAYDVDSITK